MTETRFPALAGATMTKIVGDIKPDQVGAPTPCAEYDVRGLVNHLLFWGPSLAGAGRKEVVPPPAEADTAIDLTRADWAADLRAQTEDTVTAWTPPGAWEGMTRMAGPDEMPAAMIGGMVVAELVVHGWDLARATGQRPVWEDDLIAFAYAEVEKTTESGRQMGVYGPRFDVPASAPVLDRMLGLTGRDPGWTSPA